MQRITNVSRALSALFAAAALVTMAPRVEADEGVSELKDNLDLPFDAITVTAEEEEPASDLIQFYGQILEGDGVFYCLDRSASTGDGELEIEKREVIRNIREFSRDVEFGIVFYDREILKYPPDNKPAKASDHQKSVAINFVSKVEPGQLDCVAKGLAACLDYANRSSAKRKLIIYLGDGCTQCVPDDTWYAKYALKEVRRLNSFQTRINAFCVGREGDVCETFPTSLANQNSGKYVRVAR